MANTFGPKGAFAGVLHCFTDHEGDGRGREEVLGPFVVKLQGRYGKGELPSDVHSGVPLGAIFKLGGAMLRWWLSGGAQPSAFYSSQRKALAEETRLDKGEYKRLHESVL